MRPISAAALLTAVLSLTATACGGSTSTAHAAAKASSPTVSASPDHDADVCKHLAGMKFDASTQDTTEATMDRLEALLKLQPSYMSLGRDIMASGNALGAVDADLVDVQFGTAGAARQYQTDTSKLKDALLALPKDCRAHGLMFSVQLTAAS